MKAICTGMSTTGSRVAVPGRPVAVDVALNSLALFECGQGAPVSPAGVVSLLASVAQVQSHWESAFFIFPNQLHSFATCSP